jgi:hypothetical protein
MSEQELKVSESEFYMWRSVFAIAHADGVISDMEVQFMHDVLDKYPFSDFQRDILKNDIKDKQDIMSMFSLVSEQEHRSQFFYFARMLCWCDGDFDAQEQEIMTKLKKSHIENLDFDKMISSVNMEIDEGTKSSIAEDMSQLKGNTRGFLKAFTSRFNKMSL